jgi:hypothetical protein
MFCKLIKRKKFSLEKRQHGLEELDLGQWWMTGWYGYDGYNGSSNGMVVVMVVVITVLLCTQCQ